ncbi:MAG TPA: family 10 glycosylhydrolase [Longimicrobiales bacterium]|nr:family 10 glycosylhydrolase [Longimicrobiales bacterium]
MNRRSLLPVIGLLACSHVPAPVAPAPAAPTAIEGVPARLGEVPAMPREARGVWIATVGNMDWPSRPGLPADSQRAELRRIFDHVQRLRMNLVILQVRPSGDALYPSALEPWSAYLTGEMGRAPEPYYDPLAFAIEEAHGRGLELHAWFNPYRARHPSARGQASPLHISRAKPQLVRKYGTHLWMDPGEPEVQAHSLRVILDVVRRYDIDGVHIDDYFYPYREYSNGQLIDFPDEPSWTRYVNFGGTLERADWRRQNVDVFVQRLHEAVRSAKPHVKFGISPFGIWRPGFPESVRGLDAYVELYADSRKWLNNGWLDYFAPQLYWQVSAPQQSYQELLSWWSDENRYGRHIWPGNAAFRVRRDQQNWPPEEIAQQIILTRNHEGATGNIHFNMSSLLRNQGGVTDVIANNAYTHDALMPATTWLDNVPPPAPRIRVIDHAVEITAADGEEPFIYAVRLKMADGWHAVTIPADRTRFPLPRAPGMIPEVVAVTAVDRNGNESAAVKASLSALRFRS